MTASDSIKRVNTGRQFEIDLVKFIAIPLMILVHVYEHLGEFDHVHSFPDSLFRNVIEFLGGPPAAPVFMFCMGIGMIYTKHDSASEFFKRGLKLLIAGFVLNFLRQTLPQLIGKMIGIETNYDLLAGIFTIDILQFAGMAFMTVALMKKLKISTTMICLIAFLMQAVGVWAAKIDFELNIPLYLLGLIIPTNLFSAFSVTLWLVFPALGMLFGEYLQKCDDKKKMYTRLLGISLVIFASLSSSCLYFGIDLRYMFVLYEDMYYYISMIGTLWIMSFVLSLISICYLVFIKLEKTKAGNFVRYCSTNLNTIYFIQWLIVCYSLSAAIAIGIEKTTSPLIIVALCIIVTAVSVLISVPVSKIRAKIKQKKTSAAG